VLVIQIFLEAVIMSSHTFDCKIHHNSERNEQPLLVHNCGGMSDELLHSELFGHKRGACTGAISDRLGLFPAADGVLYLLMKLLMYRPLFRSVCCVFCKKAKLNHWTVTS